MSSPLTYSTFDSIQDSVSYLRVNFDTGKARPLSFRKLQIQQLYDLVKDNEERIYEALAKDMNKPRSEALSGDIAPVLEECLYFLDNLDRLAKEEKVKPRLGMHAMDTVKVRRDPLGVVLIIGCWNYPVQLSLVPLVGAIAAGNAVVLKLSEISSYTAALLTELIPRYLNNALYRVVNGAVEETTFLLTQKFDHIFYTGSPNVGKIVMAAASKHLTGVTLELGGKSPAVITEDADIQLVANRIAFGKFYNCGQICIAVDYVLCPAARLDEFTNAFRKTIKEWFGENPKNSKDYARLVSVRHVDRIAGIIENRKSGGIVFGGDVDRDSRYIAPTLITDVKFNDDVLMGEEIFGPVLPVITYNNLDEAITLIKKNPPPLVLYIFSKKQKLIEQVLQNTQSGGVCVNDTLMHQAEYALPFGGVGNSGVGNYHGHRSFNTFTHERAILQKKQKLEFINKVRYPPYNSSRDAILRNFMVTHPYIVYLKRNRGPIKTILILIFLFLVYLKKRA
ncbi:Aldehyde/histidinol dehydrogenase [Halteromyces radiatus]|uniref:Aldehyde/histidinol dehydrogenase n=1 Tax=Halteromyces radiatus TaxID=101107 RepID=UPI00221F0EB3|nr:Aldehyde/histidinol dehydrogenase [Halteromyces radiatus]KAI8081614.1 Aldehyde/histidinol dehydrogenase [Halteromyces radiatus]